MFDELEEMVKKERMSKRLSLNERDMLEARVSDDSSLSHLESESDEESWMGEILDQRAAPKEKREQHHIDPRKAARGRLLQRMGTSNIFQSV